jgi:hypothetical protein
MLSWFRENLAYPEEQSELEALRARAEKALIESLSEYLPDGDRKVLGKYQALLPMRTANFEGGVSFDFAAGENGEFLYTFPASGPHWSPITCYGVQTLRVSFATKAPPLCVEYSQKREILQHKAQDALEALARFSNPPGHCSRQWISTLRWRVSLRQCSIRSSLLPRWIL